MKKEILSLIVLLVLTSCHSVSTEAVSSDSVVIKAVDSISVLNDSVKVDSVDSLKSK